MSEEFIRELLRSRHIPEPVAPGSEEEFFRRTGVPGYAAADGAVVMNPAVTDSNTYMGVWANEAARQEMNANGDFFTFGVTPKQDEWSRRGPYANNPQALRQTIAARILSGDDSLQPYTPEQIAAAHRSAGRMLAASGRTGP